MAKDAASLVYDYLVFVIFILLSSLIPLWSKLRAPNKTSTKADYVFAAGASVSMGAMMLSIARGTLGVRSFLGYPSELFYRGSAMWETLYGMLCAYPVVCFVFVPVYYSLGITSVYQYLDMRFNSRLVRCLASGTYIVRQLLNLGVTVFTPCVALNTVIGVPYWASIMSITAISVIFTILGGLKAAILADVVQGLTMIAVSFAIIIQACIEVGGFGNVFNISVERGRLKFFQFAFDPTVRVDTLSAWLGQLFMSLTIFGCQQNFVQRYLSMGSQKKVTKTLMSNMPVITVLFSLSWVAGMGIFAAYSDCDPLTTGYIKKMDEILPFFVEDKFTYIPGLLGLCMGTLFNGALSLSVSNLNSLSTVTWEDFLSHAPIFKGYTDKQQLNVIKTVGCFYGIIIMGISFGVGLLSGVIESSLLMTSATSGPLLGVFVLAMLIPCANWKGAATGMIVSHIITLWITFGGLTVEKAPTVMLPLSTAGCTNESFSSHIYLPGQQWPVSTPLEVDWAKNNISSTVLNTNASDLTSSEQHSDPLKALYSITYMYYSFIGTTLTVIIGTIISYFTSSENDIYDEKLLHPFILKLSRLCPGKPRAYLGSKCANSAIIKKETISKQVASDNFAFDINETEESNTLKQKNGILKERKSSRNQNGIDDGKHCYSNEDPECSDENIMNGEKPSTKIADDDVIIAKNYVLNKIQLKDEPGNIGTFRKLDHD